MPEPTTDTSTTDTSTTDTSTEDTVAPQVPASPEAPVADGRSLQRRRTDDGPDGFGGSQGDVAEAAAVLASQGEVTGPDSFPHRTDDGLFGPSSVAWKLFLDPSAQIGMVCAVLMQALNPNMMRLFDKASHNKADPQGRAQRTGKYVLTTVFADTVHANAAGAAVRRLHSYAHWTDPVTGEELHADTPEWLEWTHNAIVWGVLRASDIYGPPITAREQDRFVVEMHAAAELVGIDPRALVSTRRELDDYITEQAEWMALTLPAAEASQGLRHTDWFANPLRTVPTALVQAGIATLLPGWAKDLYGVREGRLRRQCSRACMRALLVGSRRTSSVDERLRSTLADVDAHPYRRTRAEREAAHHAPEHGSS